MHPNYQQGDVTLAHAAGRSATTVKALTGENFTLTLDLQCLSSMTCDLSVFVELLTSAYFSIFQYVPAFVT